MEEKKKGLHGWPCSTRGLRANLVTDRYHDRVVLRAHNVGAYGSAAVEPGIVIRHG